MKTEDITLLASAALVVILIATTIIAPNHLAKFLGPFTTEQLPR